jgi:hypothetical protein
MNIFQASTKTRKRDILKLPLFRHFNVYRKKLRLFDIDAQQQSESIKKLIFCISFTLSIISSLPQFIRVRYSQSGPHWSAISIFYDAALSHK